MTKEVPYEDNMTDWNDKYGLLRDMWISTYVPKAGRLLDVAGYHGDLKKYISKDIDYHLVDLFAPNAEGNIVFDLNSLNHIKMPYEDKFFDTIVALDIFEHIKRPFELLEEIGRILKDDGLLITSSHLIVTKRHYFDIAETFFEDWKIEKKLSMAEGTYRDRSKMVCIMMQTDTPSEVFYLLRKT